MIKDYEIIKRECDKRITELNQFDLDSFYKSFGADDSTLKSMITKFFLEDLKVPNLFERIHTLSSNIFQDEDYLPESLFIPKSIDIFGRQALYGSTKVLNLTLEGQDIIPVEFASKSNIEKITILSGTTRIQAKAFAECSKLKEITIPDSISFIDLSAFDECTNLKSIILPNSVLEELDSVAPDLVWITDEDGEIIPDMLDSRTGFFATHIKSN